MSTINTNGIDANYPEPGKNNSSQGFRNNFQSIKTNLNAAASEITDLQTNVVLKSALANTTLNNDMANALISNAAISGFRSTTYNLGNDLSGTVIIDRSVADVQYGTVTANTTLQFSNWAPTGTESKITLHLSVSNANAYISFPSEVVFTNNNYGMTIFENYSNIANIATITCPANVSEISFQLSTLDCGNSIYIEPLNRPYQSTMVQQRTPGPTGSPGDKLGTIAVDANYFYVCTDSYNATAIPLTAVSTTSGANVITFGTSVPGNVSVNMPVIFDTMKIANVSVNTFGNINSGQTYYVSYISGANIAISQTRVANVAGANLALTTVGANLGNTSMDATFYSGNNIWKRITLTTW